jgi:hypothetical protein
MRIYHSVKDCNGNQFLTVRCKNYCSEKPDLKGNAQNKLYEFKRNAK